MRVICSVRQKGMKRGAEKQIAKSLGFEYADVRDFVAHLELDATCSKDLLFLREITKVIHYGGSISIRRISGEETEMTWPDRREKESNG